MGDALRWLARLAAGIQHHFAWLPPALARLIVGYIFVRSGWGKLQNPARVEQFFRELGASAPELLASLVSSVELVCGALLLLGLATRLAALPLLAVIAISLATATEPRFGSMTDLFATPEFLWAALLVGIVVLGAGRLSLDALAGPSLTRSASKLQ